MSIPEGYINAKDAARILGLTPTTVSGWALDGKLPAAKKFKDGCRQINIWEMDAILRAKAKLPVKKKEKRLLTKLLIMLQLLEHRILIQVTYHKRVAVTKVSREQVIITTAKHFRSHFFSMSFKDQEIFLPR